MAQYKYYVTQTGTEGDNYISYEAWQKLMWDGPEEKLEYFEFTLMPGAHGKYMSFDFSCYEKEPWPTRIKDWFRIETNLRRGMKYSAVIELGIYLSVFCLAAIKNELMGVIGGAAAITLLIYLYDALESLEELKKKYNNLLQDGEDE